MKGIIVGIIAGVLGALVWALVAFYFEAEIGYLAWGIGIAVGLAVAWGTEGGPKNGIIAVVIAVVAIIAGKYAAVEIAIASAKSQSSHSLDDEEYLMTWLASAIAYNIQEDGGQVNWPKGVTADTAENMEDYPVNIWMTAQAGWAAMSDDDRASFKSDVQAQIDSNLNQVRSKGFMESFSGFDIIFFLLAISTAFKIASRPNPQYAAETTSNQQENFTIPDEQ